MTRNARVALVAFALALLFVYALDWLRDCIELDAWIPYFKEYPSLRELPRAGRFAFALAGLLLPMFLGSLWLLEGGLRSGIRVAGKDGNPILLRPEAVERPVNRDVMGSVESVLKVSSLAEQSGRGVGLDVFITVVDRSDVPAVQGAVRASAERTLRRLTGTSDASNIRVIVRSVAPAAREGRERPVRRRRAEVAGKK